MEFRLLGPLEAHDGGQLLALGAAKQRALLARLLLEPNRTVATEQLIVDLWARTSPPPR
jgi:DNA-binding SARP family transcriptional activator